MTESDGERTSAENRAEFWNQRYFALGPDRGMDVNGHYDARRPADLRWTRPYFLVPLDEGEEYLAQVRKRILSWSAWAATQPTSYVLRDIDLWEPAGLVRALRDAAGQASAGDGNQRLRGCLRSLLSRRALSIIDTAPEEVLGELAAGRGDASRTHAGTGSAARATRTAQPSAGAALLFQTVLGELNALLVGPLLNELQASDAGSPEPRGAGASPDLSEWAAVSDVDRIQSNRLILARALATLPPPPIARSSRRPRSAGPAACPSP